MRDSIYLWRGLKITKSDHAVDFGENCLVCRYQQGIYEALCKMFVNADICLPEMVSLSAENLDTFEWKRGVMVPEEFIMTPIAPRST